MKVTKYAITGTTGKVSGTIVRQAKKGESGPRSVASWPRRD